MTILILNSGLGKRMNKLTMNTPKCMVEIAPGETILSRQLRQIAAMGIVNTIITTGPFETVIKNCCESAGLPLVYNFVHNPMYAETNYIYSIYLAREFFDDDIIMMHGDLVFEDDVLELVMNSKESCMTVCSGIPLPEKDFKAVIDDNRVIKVGVEFFDNAIAAQPMYKLLHNDFKIWLDRIILFCEIGRTGCYAENALNEITGRINLQPLDIENRLCLEIDTPEDLKHIISILKNGL